MSATYLSELSVGLDWECWPLLRSVYISREIMNNLIKVEEIDFSYSFCLQVAFFKFPIKYSYYNKRSVLRRQSGDTNRNIKRSVYCQYG